MSRLDGERQALVPADRSAGVVCRWSLTAQLVEAPALAGAVIVKGIRELAGLVERPSQTAVMDGIAIEGLGPMQAIKFRKGAEDGEIGNRPRGGLRDRRAAGDTLIFT